MLNVTENAQAVVNGLTNDAGMGDDAGLRIALAEDEAQLQVSLVPEPEASDQVVEDSDAKVYVAQDTSPALDGQTLDATQTDEGIGFTLQPNA